jgi:hypothetical protein
MTPPVVWRWRIEGRLPSARCGGEASRTVPANGSKARAEDMRHRDVHVAPKPVQTIGRSPGRIRRGNDEIDPATIADTVRQNNEFH